MNVFGIALLMPFLSMVSDPSIIHKKGMFSALYNYFGFSVPLHFVVFFGALAFISLLATNLLLMFTAWLTARIIVSTRINITQLLFESYIGRVEITQYGNQ